MMNMVQNNGFKELSTDELIQVDGGSAVGGILIGVAVGWLLDGFLSETTGKSGSEHLNNGIKCVASGLSAGLSVPGLMGLVGTGSGRSSSHTSSSGRTHGGSGRRR